MDWRDGNPFKVNFFRRSESLQKSLGLRPHGQESGRAAERQATGTIFQPEQLRSHGSGTLDRFAESQSGN
jgi:hypothetical protein